MVTSHTSDIEESVVDIVCPFGRVPLTEKVIVSLLGSCATIVTFAVVLTVMLSSVGPTKIFGGKFSKG